MNTFAENQRAHFVLVDGEPRECSAEVVKELMSLRATVALYRSTHTMRPSLEDLHQDVIQALDGDLETGTHHGNNAAWAAFNTRYHRFNTAFAKLGEAIGTITPDKEAG
jgi:hypothetical protein